MTPADFIASRQIFHSKTDCAVNQLRHDIVIKGNLIYRYSRLAEVDFTMSAEEKVIDEVLAAGLPAVPVATKFDGNTFQIMRRARGQPLSALSLEEKRPVWAELAVMLRRLHEIRGKGAGLVVGHPLIGAYSRWETYITHLAGEHVLYCLAHQLIDAEEASAILGEVADWTPPETADSLLHNDLNDQNVFALDGRLSDIIDWEDALIGDPIFDLASWATFTAHHDEVKAFVDAYYGDTARPEDGDWRLSFYCMRISLSRLVQLHRYGYTDLTVAKWRLHHHLRALR